MTAASNPTHELSQRQRWLALYVLCIGTLMIVLDTTVVNVALPSIRGDLQFSETSLVWVINAYMLTFGGCLLLGGRLGDWYGHRRIFLTGIVVFTLASLACGLAQTRGMLIGARAVQGIAGAVVDAIALSLVVDLFREPAERAKAMGFYGFVCAGGGSVGVLLGGFLTSALNWHWVFLINIPIGIAVFALCLRLLPDLRGSITGKLDLGGAASITFGLMLAIYAIVNGNEAGWLSAQTLSLLGAALALFALFFWIESRAANPLMPLRMLALHNVAVSNVIAMLWSGAMFSWFFISALYLQQVLHYDPFEVGLAFLPSNLIMAACSVSLSATLVTRYGLRIPMAAGLGMAALGLALFARAPVDGNVWIDVLPGMVLAGFGGGIAFNPVLMAAMSDVEPEESGLASGMVNTAFMLGGSLALAALAAAAAARSATLAQHGADATAALNGGYQLAFMLGAIAAGLAAVIGGCLIRNPAQPPPAAH